MRGTTAAVCRIPSHCSRNWHNLAVRRNLADRRFQESNPSSQTGGSGAAVWRVAADLSFPNQKIRLDRSTKRGHGESTIKQQTVVFKLVIPLEGQPSTQSKQYASLFFTLPRQSSLLVEMGLGVRAWLPLVCRTVNARTTKQHKARRK